MYIVVYVFLCQQKRDMRRGWDEEGLGERFEICVCVRLNSCKNSLCNTCNQFDTTFNQL